MKETIIISKDRDQCNRLSALINILFPGVNVSRGPDCVGRSDDHFMGLHLKNPGISGEFNQ